MILVSENEWRTFRDTDTGTGLVEPTIVSFPAYSKKDLVRCSLLAAPRRDCWRLLCCSESYFHRFCVCTANFQQAEILMMNWKADSDEAAENDKIEQDTEATAHALVTACRCSAAVVIFGAYPVLLLC